MGEHARITGFLSQCDRLQCLRQCPYLIELNEHRISDALPDPLGNYFGVSNKDVISGELYLLAQLFCKYLPAFPIVLGKAVFD